MPLGLVETEPNWCGYSSDTFLKSGSFGEQNRNQVSIQNKALAPCWSNLKVPDSIPPRLFFSSVFFFLRFFFLSFFFFFLPHLFPFPFHSLLFI